MGEYGQHAVDESHRLWNVPVSNTSTTWTLLTTVFGAYALFKALEIAGFPMSLYIVRLVGMLAGPPRLPRAASGSSEAGSDSDTMQTPGGLLGSILGSHSQSLLQKGVTRFTSALSSGPSYSPPGLGNMSNSCYQNSVIQGLAALPSLRDYLSTLTTEHPSFTADSTNGALHDLINSLNDPANLGKNFWIRGKLKSMSTFTQQDAQEYFSKILDDMDREVKKASCSKRRSSVSWLEATKSLDTRMSEGRAITNPLDGLIAQRVGCTSCGYSEGLSLIDFNCITVSLGNNNSYDIRDCLDEYTKLEYIDGVECGKCTLLKLQKTLAPLATAGSPFEAKLKTVSELINDEKFEDNTLVKTLNIPKKNWVQSSKSKQIVVARAPKSLVIHVNRSNFDEMTGASYKNTASVFYPRILDLGNWCLGSSPSGSKQPDMSLEEWPRDPTQSMLVHADDLMSTSPFQYRLRAAVTHFGSHANGHYVCYRPHARHVPQSESGHELDDQSSPDEQWWRFSDDTVYAVPEEQAHQANVFMLFYERIDVSTASKAVEADSAPVQLHVTEAAPLPPDFVSISEMTDYDTDIAITIPLPEDDEVLEISLDESSAVGPAKDATSTPNDSSHSPLFQNSVEKSAQDAVDDTEAEKSEAESEDASSTQFASDSAAERFSPASKPYIRVPPHTMRTAGNAAVRGQSSRRSLPMVSAT